MTASLVTTGEMIASASDVSAGEGCIEIDGQIVAAIIGHFEIVEGVATVSASKSINEASIGDTVICEIVKLNEKNGEAIIHVIEGKKGSILPSQLYGQFHVTGIVDKYMHQTSDAVRRRDICRAVIKEVEPVIRIDFRERDDCGVLHAICPPCGDTLVAEANGDWNVKCNSCGYTSFRALADNFNSGWAELEEGASVLNNAGKRWGREAEAMFSKGPAGRATFIAADVREDGRERTYFRFEGEGGGGGRRQKAAPGCRLFIGGMARDVTSDQLRDLFSAHGDITDCFVPEGEGTANKGFGFITFSQKSEADAAITALNGHKLNGRKIAVKDADDDSKKNKQKRPDGAKIYLGNLSFKATEDDIKKMFEGKATVNQVSIATDKAGKPKGFAFVFIKEKDSAADVVSQLNGSELNGRKIKVDVSSDKPRDKRGGKDNKSGKSARELRAMREEEEDSKKKKRRPKKRD